MTWTNLLALSSGFISAMTAMSCVTIDESKTAKSFSISLRGTVDPYTWIALSIAALNVIPASESFIKAIGNSVFLLEAEQICTEQIAGNVYSGVCISRELIASLSNFLNVCRSAAGDQKRIDQNATNN
jgi:hypothetical protein